MRWFFNGGSLVLVIALGLLLTVGVSWNPLAYSTGALALAAAGVLLACGGIKPEGLNVQIPRVRSLSVFVLAVIWLFLRAGASPAPELVVADRRLISVAAASVILLHLVLPLLERNSLFRRLILSGFVLLVLGNLAAASYQRYVNPDWNLWGLHSITATNVRGLYSHHNTMASVMAACAAYSMAAVFLAESLTLRVVMGSVSFAAGVTIFFSQSRGGMIALIVSLCAVFGLTVLHRFLCGRGRLRAIFVSAFVVAVIICIGSGFYLDYMEDRRGYSFLFAQARMNLFSSAFDIALEHPLFGHGARVFSWKGLIGWSVEYDGWISTIPLFVHNETLELLTGYGLIGVILVSGILLFAVFNGCLIISTHQGHTAHNRTVLVVGALAGMTAFLVQAQVSFLAHIPATLALLCVHLAILLPGESVDVRSGRRFGLIILPLGVVALVGWTCKNLWESHQLSLSAPNLQIARRVDLQYRVGELMVYNRPVMDGAAEACRQLRLAREPVEREGWYRLAMEGYDLLERLNPKLPELKAGRATLEDLMGRHAAAEGLHRQAVASVGDVAVRLGYSQALGRNLLHQASSSKIDPQRKEPLVQEALGLLHGRWQQICESRAVYENRVREYQYAYALKLWLSGRRLYQEGDRLWKGRRAERGMAFMLEGLKKYQQSRALVEGVEPRWKAEFEQLNVNLGILREGRVVPARLTEEEISEVAALDTREGLASEGTRR